MERLFDLHCDTLTEAYDRVIGFRTREKVPPLGIFPKAVRNYADYRQVFAIWSRQELSDEDCWNRYLKIRAFADNYLAAFPSNTTPYLSVEGGKLLGGKIERLDRLFSDGIRILTLTWGGTCCIGGAHDTELGLTDFGIEVVNRCFSLGILPDVSHASDSVFSMTAQIARRYGKPMIASHSDSRSLCRHSRNLTDNMFRQIRDSGGIVGISLCRSHLSQEDTCNIKTVCDHICHYLTLGGENTVCLGCDIDGTYPLPDGIETVADLSAVASELKSRGIDDSLIDRIAYRNAADFFERNGIRSYRKQN